jgi:acetolactate decarboxylase
MKNIAIVISMSLLVLAACKEKVAEVHTDDKTNVIVEKEAVQEIDRTSDSGFQTKEINNVKKVSNVQVVGSLHDVMAGNFAATISLKELANTPHLYALGALEHLAGEIQIFDGEPMITKRSEEMMSIDRSYNTSAALLVYASVAEWEEITVPPMVKSQGQFEIFLQQQADKAGIDTTKPFPFLLVGGVAKLNWHVVNGKELSTVSTKQSHMKTGLNGVITHAYVDILGFYDNSNAGNFVHKGSKTHMHFRAQHADVAAHVDSMFLGQDLTLKLPKQ